MGNADSTITAEAERILWIAVLNSVEEPKVEISSCSQGDNPDHTRDLCVINGKPIFFDDIFSLANAKNLERKIVRDVDHKNYFFKLSPDAVFFRKGSAPNSDFRDGALLYRSPGSLEWKTWDFKEIQSSPDLKAAIVPILMNVVRSRSGYDRMNKQPYQKDDYDYVQAKAIWWLINFVPKGDPALKRVLLESFPQMGPGAARAAFFRLKEEGATESLVPTLIDRTQKSEMAEINDEANRMLGELDISPEDRSLERQTKPFFYGGLSGGLYLPWYKRELDGAKEPLGGYMVGEAGALFCFDSIFECSRKRKLFMGVAIAGGGVINGYGYRSVGGNYFVGSDTFGVAGYLGSAVDWYPTKGFSGDRDTSWAVEAGTRLSPLDVLPLSLEVAVRIHPLEIENGAVLFGIGNRRSGWGENQSRSRK